MSEKNKVGKKEKNNTKFALLAGILAFGILASALAGSLMITNAVAQTSSNGEQDQERVVTSIDDIDCDKVRSVVHCVENQTIVEGQGSTSTSALTSAPLYHYAGTSSTVSTSGTATTKIKPDKFSVMVGVETDGATAREAASKNADLMAQVLAALRDLGIAENQTSTTNYNVFPVYEYKEPAEVCIMIYPPPPECQPKQQIIGYKAVNSVTVTLDVDGDVDAGKVIDTAIEAGANNVNGVYFFISQEEQQEIRDSLISDAIANARHRAEIAADALQMVVSGVQSVNLNDVYFPIFSRGFSGVAESVTPILPGEQEVSTTVNIIFYISSGIDGLSQEDNNTTAADNAIATARQFILAKLPALGIEIDDELDLHTDMLVHVSENEFNIDFSVLDVNGQSHDGHIEVVNGEVTVAILDGQSIL